MIRRCAITKKEFTEIEGKSKRYSYTSLKHVDYDDLSGFKVVADDEDILLVCGVNEDFGVEQCHYAFNDLDCFLSRTENMSDFLMTFVDDGFIERLKAEGYEIFGVWRDYFNPDISSFTGAGRYEHLTQADYKRASDITQACRLQSRGFMGQTEGWIAGWVEGGKMDVSDATILTHSENSELAGIICVGIYGHESEKGAVLWVRELAVHPDCQRRGIATKLMRQAFGYGKSHGAKRAFLMADDMNLGAIHIYKKMGFAPNENECETAMYKPSKQERGD